MEREKNHNGFTLIGHSVGRLNGKFSQCFVGTFTFVAPLLVVLLGFGVLGLCFNNLWLLTIGVLIDSIMFGMLDTGYIKYFRAVLNDENPSLAMIFSEVRITKHALLLVLLSAILMGMYIVGTLLFIVTVGFVITFFSMMFFVVDYYKITTFRKSFWITATLMLGNRLHMLAYKYLFYLIYAVLIGFGFLCGCLVYTMLATNIALAVTFAICGAIVFLFAYSLVTVYYHACNESFFEDCLIHKAIVDARDAKSMAEYKAKLAAETNATVEPVAEPKVDTTSDTTETESETPAPAKKTTTAKKSPAKKATSTVKKSTAKKTATKKASK